MLEVHDPANCELFLKEPPETGGGNLDYSIERCTPDRPQNPTMLACGTMGEGTRVFDIRDPYRPAEIAYWKGPAVRKTFLPRIRQLVTDRRSNRGEASWVAVLSQGSCRERQGARVAALDRR
jgi:hypothetical protein